MKKMKKKRMAKFEAHCTKIFRPYVEQVINGEDCDLFNLSRAIDGIIYQYVGDEGRFLRGLRREGRGGRCGGLQTRGRRECGDAGPGDYLPAVRLHGC